MSYWYLCAITFVVLEMLLGLLVLAACMRSAQCDDDEEQAGIARRS